MQTLRARAVCSLQKGIGKGYDMARVIRIRIKLRCSGVQLKQQIASAVCCFSKSWSSANQFHGISINWVPLASGFETSPDCHFLPEGHGFVWTKMPRTEFGVSLNSSAWVFERGMPPKLQRETALGNADKNRSHSFELQEAHRSSWNLLAAQRDKNKSRARCLKTFVTEVNENPC